MGVGEGYSESLGLADANYHIYCTENHTKHPVISYNRKENEEDSSSWSRKTPCDDSNKAHAPQLLSRSSRAPELQVLKPRPATREGPPTPLPLEKEVTKATKTQHSQKQNKLKKKILLKKKTSQDIK